MTDDRYVSPHTDNPRSLECVRCMSVCVVKSIMDINQCRGLHFRSVYFYYCCVLSHGYNSEKKEGSICELMMVAMESRKISVF